MFCEIDPGNINYSVHSGYGGLNCYYGPCAGLITVKGMVVAKVADEDVVSLKRLGAAVWNAYYITHTPIKMVLRRVG